MKPVAAYLEAEQRFRAHVIQLARHEGRAFEVKRGQLLLNPGGSSSPLFVIEEGAAHAFVESSSGQQTLRLGYPGEFLASLPSFYLGVATPIGIQALRRCRGYTLTRQQLRSSLQSQAEVVNDYLHMLEAFVCGHTARELDLLESDPAKRYAALVKRSPQVLQHIPLRYLASYLRMAPATLSRLRRAT